jgi:hypothetical protein
MSAYPANLNPGASNRTAFALSRKVNSSPGQSDVPDNHAGPNPGIVAIVSPILLTL